MQILKDIYVIGGGEYGIGLSHRLDCNVYLIDGGNEIALIDAGVGIDTEKIVENIKEELINLKKIRKLILTHAHLDHAGGAANIKNILNTDIYISGKEAKFIESGDEEAIGLNLAKKCGIYPDEFKLKPVKIDCRLKGDEEIKIGRYNIKVIPTPGHSKGSVCLLLKSHDKKVLFTGDTVFMRGLLSILNLPDSSLADYRKGIKNLSGLKIDSLIPSHYGFTLNDGQIHIDMALDALSNLSIPPMM